MVLINFIIEYVPYVELPKLIIQLVTFEGAEKISSFSS